MAQAISSLPSLTELGLLGQPQQLWKAWWSAATTTTTTMTTPSLHGLGRCTAQRPIQRENHHAQQKYYRRSDAVRGPSPARKRRALSREAEEDKSPVSQPLTQARSISKQAPDASTVDERPPPERQQQQPTGDADGDKNENTVTKNDNTEHAEAKDGSEKDIGPSDAAYADPEDDVEDGLEDNTEDREKDKDDGITATTTTTTTGWRLGQGPGLTLPIRRLLPPPPPLPYRLPLPLPMTPKELGGLPLQNKRKREGSPEPSSSPLEATTTTQLYVLYKFDRVDQLGGQRRGWRGRSEGRGMRR